MPSGAWLAVTAGQYAQVCRSGTQSHPWNSWDEGRDGVAPLVAESAPLKEFERNG